MRNKTIVMVAVWGAVGLAVIGLLLAGLASSWGSAFGWSGESIFQGGENVEHLREGFSADRIDKLDIDVSLGEVTLVYSDTDEITVVQTGSENLPDFMRITASQNGGTLSVRTPNANFTLPDLRNTSNHIEIAIPNEYAEDLSIKLSTGDLTLREFWALQDMDISVSLGSLKTRSPLEAEKAKLRVSTGSLEIDSLYCDQVNLSCSLGDVTVGELRGAGKISNSTGSVRLKKTELTGDLTVSNSLGDVKVELIPDQSIEFHGKTSLGDISAYFGGEKEGSNLTATLGSGEHRLEVTNSTGSVEIDEA